MMPTREEIAEQGKKLGWDINEPYQIYTAPWSQGMILRDDTGFDDVAEMRGELRHTDGGMILLTRMLPNGAKVQVYVDGYGHTLEATAREPIGLDF